MGDNTVSGEGTDFDGSIVDFGDSKIDKGFLDALQHYNRVCYNVMVTLNIIVKQ